MCMSFCASPRAAGRQGCRVTCSPASQCPPQQLRKGETRIYLVFCLRSFLLLLFLPLVSSCSPSHFPLPFCRPYFLPTPISTSSPFSLLLCLRRLPLFYLFSTFASVLNRGRIVLAPEPGRVPAAQSCRSGFPRTLASSPGAFRISVHPP